MENTKIESLERIEIVHSVKLLNLDQKGWFRFFCLRIDKNLLLGHYMLSSFRVLLYQPADLNPVTLKEHNHW